MYEMPLAVSWDACLAYPHVRLPFIFSSCSKAMQQLTDPLGFSADDDEPIHYIRRTHAWYEALGTNNPYRYASFSEVPFAALSKPLDRCRVALLTTAAPFDPAKGAQDCKAPYNASAKFYEVYSGDSSLDHDLRVSHVSVDREHLTDDSNCWFPLPALRRAQAQGRIGEIARRFHGIPTNRSQRHTLQVDCPEVFRRCAEDQVDAAILVANCPVCHQTMSLVSRHLESNGISTVVMGAAKDIVERCGVARFVFSDFPLGNAAARPFDIASQDSSLGLALSLLEHAFAPRTTVQNPLRWTLNPEWRQDYLNLSQLTSEELARRREEFLQSKSIAQSVRGESLKRKSSS